MLRLRCARGWVREPLALIDTAKENRRWEFLIYQSGKPRRKTGGGEGKYPIMNRNRNKHRQ
jgi:hypothetical protein